jgi:hypothetical protein
MNNHPTDDSWEDIELFLNEWPRPRPLPAWRQASSKVALTPPAALAAGTAIGGCVRLDPCAPVSPMPWLGDEG